VNSMYEVDHTFDHYRFQDKKYFKNKRTN
jgi:hypothetical protein